MKITPFAVALVFAIIFLTQRTKLFIRKSWQFRRDFQSLLWAESPYNTGPPVAVIKIKEKRL